jgi:hypothetical protein
LQADREKDLKDSEKVVKPLSIKHALKYGFFYLDNLEKLKLNLRYKNKIKTKKKNQNKFFL